MKTNNSTDGSPILRHCAIATAGRKEAEKITGICMSKESALLDTPSRYHLGRQESVSPDMDNSAPHPSTRMFSVTLVLHINLQKHHPSLI